MATNDPAGAQYERIIDPAQEAQNRAALLDWQIRQNPGAWVRLGNGAAVKVQPGMPFKYAGDETHEMLDHPGGIWSYASGEWRMLRNQGNETTSMLLNPKPPFAQTQGGVVITFHRYAWFVRTPAVKDDLRPQQTANYHRNGKIRYIETSEIDRNSPIALYEEFATPNNVYVVSGTMILAEIMDEALAYRKYKGFDDESIKRVISVDEIVRSQPSVMTDAGPLATHIAGKTETIVEGPKDTKRGG